MLSNLNTNVERIIAKFDNDFNPDTTDWIPRVGAWTIDALSQIDALRKVRKKIKLIVHDGIAYSECPINSPNLIVTDRYGCVIDKMKSKADCSCNSSTGEIQKLRDVTPYTVDLVHNNGANYAPTLNAETVNSRDPRSRHIIHEYETSRSNTKRNYVLIDNNKIELNFCPDCIYVETDAVETEYSETYKCEVPLVPNIGILLEYIVFYCMYKMLTRGLKHPTFNLGASQYGTNPYYEYNKLKPIAKRAVIIDEQGNINVNDGNLFQCSFFITTFK